MYQVIDEADKKAFNKKATHPLQSWQWGEFRKKTGVQVIRLGNKSKTGFSWTLQLTLHSIPFTNFTVGYVPKGTMITKEMYEALVEVGNKYNCIFIKLEPNITNNFTPISSGSNFKSIRKSPRELFTKYTFVLDLTMSEEELLKNMKAKTRYNIRLAQKHGVTVQEETSDEAFNTYLKLTQETTKRQGFYAHSPEYHQNMWDSLGPKADKDQPRFNRGQPQTRGQIAHLLTVLYKGEILVTWIVFLFNDTLYYPYGASSTKHKNVMASPLMMWETMKWGKKMGAKSFDLWGTPGPDPKPSDPYYGFHKFKLGFGPKLVEFVGSYDLVLKQPQYSLFNVLNNFRWALLKIKSHLSI